MPKNHDITEDHIDLHYRKRWQCITRDCWKHWSQHWKVNYIIKANRKGFIKINNFKTQEKRWNMHIF